MARKTRQRAAGKKPASRKSKGSPKRRTAKVRPKASQPKKKTARKAARKIDTAHRVTALAELFGKLGVPNPLYWAQTEVQYGLPQRARLLFLRQAWRYIADPADPDWMTAVERFAAEHPLDPCAGAGHALRRMKALGVSETEISELVRVMQFHTLLGLCTLIDAPVDERDGAETELGPLDWMLVSVDEDGQPLERMAWLYDDITEFDPSGRGLRPDPALLEGMRTSAGASSGAAAHG